MPFPVRLKIIFYFFTFFIAIFFLFKIHWGLGALLGILGILYLEMMWPKLNFFGKAITHVRNKDLDAVALTFDDGPSLWTQLILDILKKENVKATFFLLGKNVERYPDIARRIEAEGHVIGYHGYLHEKYHWKGPGFIREDLEACVKAFKDAGVKAAPLVRFPHGFKNIFAVQEIKKRGWTLCAWGRGVWDSKKPGVEKIVERSLKLKAGTILLLHDGDGIRREPDRSETVEALSPIIQGLKAKGYYFTVIEAR